MARIRTVKPDFWKHEELSELDPEVHLLAAALLNYADDEGYFRANPKLVKAECCPLREDSVSVHDALNQLAAIGYVRLFDGTDGKRYGHIPTFTTHQKINRPTDSKIKPLDTGADDSVSRHGAISEASSPEGNREQGTGNGREDDADDRATGEAEVNKQAVRLAAECRPMIGVDQAWSGFMDAGEVRKWLQAGADPERDIKPTIKRVMAKRTHPPNSWRYFTQAVADAKAANEQPMPEGNPDEPRHRQNQQRPKRTANPLFESEHEDQDGDRAVAFNRW